MAQQCIKMNIIKRQNFKIAINFLVLNMLVGQVHYFSHDGENREYWLYLPNSIQANAPLVFVLHGYSGSASGMINYSGMNQVADASGFAVCYPQGLSDQWNNSFWDVGYSFHQNQPVDDLGYLTSLATYLQDQYNLSTDYTFCTGMSNGGDMCYLLACQANDIFKAVAPVAGCMMAWIYYTCNPDTPVPVFEIHGTDDNITWWDGDINDDQGYGAYMGVTTAIDLWAQLNNCSQTTIDTLPDNVPYDGSFVVAHKHRSWDTGNEVWLHEVVNGGHDWPGSSGNMDITAAEEIWDFFNHYISYNNSSTDNEYSICYSLAQNYPNPFNPVTTIQYELPQRSDVQITIYNLVGREVTTLISETQNAGYKSVQWDASGFSSGMYFYQIRAGEFVQTRKMVLLK